MTPEFEQQLAWARAKYSDPNKHRGRALKVCHIRFPRLCIRCGSPLRLYSHASFCSPCHESVYCMQWPALLAVRKAVREGRLPSVKSQCCVDCGGPAAGYDHRNYDKPLDVVPVCRSCNQRRGPAFVAANDLSSSAAA
jgi:hypothetical protein